MRRFAENAVVRDSNSLRPQRYINKGTSREDNPILPIVPNWEYCLATSSHLVLKEFLLHSLGLQHWNPIFVQ